MIEVCPGLVRQGHWRQLGCYLDLGLLPLICICGVVLNLVCLMVFASHRRHPLVPALAMLCLCDFTQLFLSFFVFLIPAFHDYHGHEAYDTLGQIAYLSTGLLAPLLLASNCASIWTICYISIRRHRAVLSPLKTCRSTVTWRPLAVIAVVALLFNAIGWFELTWRWADETEVEPERNFLLYEKASFAMNGRYVFIKHQILYPVCVYIIPLILLVGLNFRILNNVSSRPLLTNDLEKRMVQERRAITLLISIITLFFLCHTGGLVIRFVQFQQDVHQQIATDLVNLLFNVNSFANPLLYFFFTRQFRDLRVSFIAARFSGRDLSKLRGSGTVSVRLLPPCSYAQLTSQPRPSVPLLFF